MAVAGIKDYFKLQRSLVNLKRTTAAATGYATKAPKEIQARHAQVVVDLGGGLNQLIKNPPPMLVWLTG